MRPSGRFLTVALLIASLGSTGCDDRSGVERGQAEQPTGQEPTTSDAPRAALPTLFSIMLALQGDMERVSRGIWAESYDAIAAGAQAIADHPKVPPEEAAAVAEVLGPDMARFQALDMRVHDLSVELVEAARTGDMATVLARDAAIRQGCVECHTAFRDRLRSELLRPVGEAGGNRP